MTTNPLSVVLLALLCLPLGTPLQAGAEPEQGQYVACHLVEQLVYGRERLVCLIRRQAGHNHGWTPQLRVDYRYTTAIWRYNCRRSVPHPGFELSIGETRHNIIRSTILVQKVNKEAGHGSARVILGRGKHLISFYMNAGSFNFNGTGFGLTKEPCTWHVTVTADNYNRP